VALLFGNRCARQRLNDIVLEIAASEGLVFLIARRGLAILEEVLLAVASAPAMKTSLKEVDGT
jgi:hypothetical protein